MFLKAHASLLFTHIEGCVGNGIGSMGRYLSYSLFVWIKFWYIKKFWAVFENESSQHQIAVT